MPNTAPIFERIQDSLSVTPDHPEPGITFYGIGPLLANVELREKAWDLLAELIRPYDVDAIVAIDSRGYLIAGPLTHPSRLGCSLGMISKPGKLPPPVHRVGYSKEYNKSMTHSLEIQAGLLRPNDRVAILDDLAATGGSLTAAAALVLAAGAIPVCAGVVVEFTEQTSRKKLLELGIHLLSLLKLDSTVPKSSQQGWAHNLGRRQQSGARSTVLIRSIPDPEDQRVVLLYYPPMLPLVNSLMLHCRGTFRPVDISWAQFPDGSPNTDFYTDSYLVNKDVLYLGTLEELGTFVEQMALAIVLPRQGIRSLTLSFPYLNTATMDVVSREGVIATVEPLAKLMSTSIDATQRGPPALQLFDIHALPSRFNFSGNVQLRMMSAIGLLRKYLEPLGSRVMLCFPDAGAAKRFHFVCEPFSARQITFNKERRGDTRVLTVADGVDHLQSHIVKSIVEVVIIDDLVMSGGTLNECRKKLEQLAPVLKGKVSAYVTHPVFPNSGWRKFMPGGDYAGLHKFYVANTVARTVERIRHRQPFVVLDIAPLILNEVHARVAKSIGTNAALTVYVGSTNGDKLQAVELALTRVLPNLTVTVKSVDGTVSGVPEAPAGAETYVGALNRLTHVIDAINERDAMYVAIESGRFDITGHPSGCKYGDAAVCVVQFGYPNVNHTHLSPMVPVPNSVAEQSIETGQTLGEVFVELGVSTSKSNWHAEHDPEGRDRIELMALGVARGITGAMMGKNSHVY